jgi:outer membrane protein TolC
MTFRSRYFVIPSLFTFAACLSLAPVARAERVLGLEEALSLGRANNRDLRAARAHLDGTAANIELAWSALLPQVSARGAYTHNYKNATLNLGAFSQSVSGLGNAIKGTSTNPAEIAAINQFEQSLAAASAGLPPAVILKGEELDLTAQATVPLVVPYAYDALKAARLDQRANVANLGVTDATVLLSVAQAYYAAAGADELTLARRHAVAVATETYDTAKARVAAGFVNRVEMTRAEVAVVRAGQDEAEAENTRDAVYRSLGTLLGTHDALRVEPVQAQPLAPAATSQLVDGAHTLRPEFAYYGAAVDAAAATERSNAWRWAPTLSGFGNARLSNYAGFTGDKYAWAVGAALDWVLYDGGARDAERHRAEAQVRENTTRLDLLRDTVRDEIVNARETLETKHKALDAALHARDLSRETLNLVRAQYEAGTAPQLDVLTAQDSLVSAEVAVVQAHFDLALADLQLQKSAGTFPPRGTTR